MKQILFCILYLTTSLMSSKAQVWQWSVPVRSDYSPVSEAFLWIPEECKEIKAVVVGQNNMEEFSILESPSFREAMAGLAIAEIWVSPAFDGLFRFNENAGVYFNEMMNSLAEISGYEELKYIPIIPIGHSAAASWPYYFAAWNPERTLAAISVSGQWPYFRGEPFAPDIWSAGQQVDYIPLLETMGEYEAAATFSGRGLKERAEHPKMALSMLACPAEGHFATSEKKNAYLAFFIRKAMQYRFPEKYSLGKTPELKAIDPVKTGWLMEKWIPNTVPTVQPAPVAAYKGDPSQAFWFFDEETVTKTMEYQSAYRNRKPQLLGYQQNGVVVPQRDSHSQVHFPLLTQEDGVTFQLKGVFLDTVPGASKRTSTWTGLPAGSAIGHAGEAIPVVVEKIIGPVKKLNDTIWRVDFERGMRERSSAYAVSFAVKHPGDAVYKPAVQQSEMLVPAQNTDGKEQEISFAALPDITVGTQSIRLQATSNSGMKVRFYVKEGPAELISENELVFTKIPPRSKYPVKVTVVAWQYGRSSEPKVQSAIPVERSFFLTKPLSGSVSNNEYPLLSPDKKIKVLLNTEKPAYQVFYNEKAFILPSKMGVDFDGMPTFEGYFKVTDIAESQHRNSWKPVYGEKEIYPDNYNELTVCLQEQIPPKRKLNIIFRAYNEGIAFRYEIPVQESIDKFTITKEFTEYAFAPETWVWEEYGHEGLYNKVLSSDIKPGCELPLTVRTSNGVYGAIAEAGDSPYPRAYVAPVAQGRNAPKRNAIQIALRSEASGQAPFKTAWRSITLAERPGALMEQNYLLLNLNEPNQLEDVSWIKPGKAFREVTQSTENAIKAIDFSVEQGISYIIFDWGWYGPHNDEANEPSSVNVVNTGTGQPIPGHKGLDLQQVIEYGKSKGVGVFLYVNRQGLERYADVIFPLYQSWGIAGIKPGFVRVGSQGWQIWNEELVKKAAKYKLMVNTHDAFRPTGFSRTYPNFMGQEGIHGNEQNPDATHSTHLPFLRYTIGAGDFTPGYFKKALKTSWAHKLSLPILFYSPVQFLYWTERLEDMEPRPELQLWKNVPTTWDDTKVLSGEIGEHAIIARRKGTDWYVGGITNNNSRELRLKFDFLKEGKKYDAVIYTDAPDGSRVLIEEKKNLTAKSELSFALIASGGFAVRLKEK